MSEDPRVPLIQGAIRAFNEEDVAALLEFIHPEVKSRVSENLGNPGVYSGIEGFGAMMADWSEAWSENTIELEDVELVNETTAFVLTNQKTIGAGSGVPLSFGTVFVIEFEGERAIRFEIHPDRDSASASMAEWPD